MPLDRVQARKLVNASAVAYSRGIHAEFIGKIAEQLNEALLVVDASTTDVQRAQNEVARLQRELDEEKTHYRKLREQSAHTEAMIGVLKEIVATPKGAGKKAADVLKAAGVVEPVAAPEKILVP